tara:strand:+ start:297 stop:452 length:156 start_codon:yes stop_codon:yes gene_type:complete
VIASYDFLTPFKSIEFLAGKSIDFRQDLITVGILSNSDLEITLKKLNGSRV